MTHLFRLAAALALAASLQIYVPSAMAQNAGGDPVISFSTEDKEMKAAIMAARATLDVFWSAYQDGRTVSASLKVAIPAPGGQIEHIFVTDIRDLGGQRYRGRIANEPVWLTDLRKGSPYEFGAAQISDWLYIRDNMMHGAYTVRVMLPQMERSNADTLRQMLAPLPPAPK